MSTASNSISPLLQKLTGGSDVPMSDLASEVAAAVSSLFHNKVSAVQCASLLTALRLTGLDEDSRIVAACAQAMRDDASKIDEDRIRKAIAQRTLPEGTYCGGLCDIVGTGGDGHSTFNVSTTASIIASGLLAVAKHGAQASSSKSGSADVLKAMDASGLNIEAINAETIIKVYEAGNYGFLFAKQFHPGMKYAAPIRKEIGFRTIFNILGPLANPLYQAMEAGVYGVYKQSLGPVYANALKLCGAKKAMVVCGMEDLDEISCAGNTSCWRIIPEMPMGSDVDVKPASNDGLLNADEMDHTTEFEHFQLQPSDFGLATHSLDDVLPGRSPNENAKLLAQILNNELSPDHPTLEFVLMNAAALFVVAGICDADVSSMGPGDDGKVIIERGPGGGRWKEGVRRARWAIESGRAARSLEAYMSVTRSL